MKLLVLGSKGFLGSYFTKQAELKNHQRFESLRDVNIELSHEKFTETSLNRLEGLVAGFDLVVNCVAMRNIEACEENPDLAEFSNSTFPGELSRAVASNGNKLIHFSTDAVYSETNVYRTENETCTPKSQYGKSKLRGEERILESGSNALICRTNFFGIAPKRDSLADFFLGAAKTGVAVKGYTDVYFAPLHASEVIEIAVSLASKKVSGIVNVMSQEKTSKYNFALKLLEKLNLDSDLIIPTNSREDCYRESLRNVDLSADTQKLQELTGHRYNLSDSLQRFAKIETGV